MLCEFCDQQLESGEAVLEVSAGVVTDDGRFAEVSELVRYLHVACPTLEDSPIEGGASCRHRSSEQRSGGGSQRTSS